MKQKGIECFPPVDGGDNRKFLNIKMPDGIVDIEKKAIDAARSCSELSKLFLELNNLFIEISIKRRR